MDRNIELGGSGVVVCEELETVGGAAKVMQEILASGMRGQKDMLSMF